MSSFDVVQSAVYGWLNHVIVKPAEYIVFVEVFLMYITNITERSTSEVTNHVFVSTDVGRKNFYKTGLVYSKQFSFKNINYISYAMLQIDS